MNPPNTFRSITITKATKLLKSSPNLIGWKRTPGIEEVRYSRIGNHTRIEVWGVWVI